MLAGRGPIGKLEPSKVFQVPRFQGFLADAGGPARLHLSMDERNPEPCEQPRNRRILEVAGVFLRLGFTAFGGPAAHIALMEAELVRRRNWVSREEFLDLLGITNLIPGPNSTEMALFLGQRRAGLPGLLVAGFAFILPAAFMTGGLAWAYLRWGRLSELRGVLAGLQPVILLIITQAVFSLGRTALKTRWHAGIGLAACAGLAVGVHELLVLAGAGLVGLSIRNRANDDARTTSPNVGAVPMLGGWAAATGSTAAAIPFVPFSIGKLFLFFLKVGSVLFGSGYVLLAFLRTDLVERWHWLSEQQLLDAFAAGQVTPGPLFTTATFIGFILGGPVGAIAATIGIFLPAFVWVAAGGRIINRLTRSTPARSALDGLNVASLSLMSVAAVQLVARVEWTIFPVLILTGSAWALFRWRVPSIWPTIAAGSLGWIAGTFGWI